MSPIEFFIPVKTVSEANSHEHWRVRQKRAKEQRFSAALHARIAVCECGHCDSAGRPKPPLVVHLTRVGARKLDSDNLQGALKHCRDGIADWLGIDDGRDDLVTWEYDQTTGKDVGVRVRVTAREAGDHG